MRTLRLLLALALGVGLTLGMFWILSPSAVRANPGTLYVSNTSPTCGGRAPCYATIQAAVNAAANGDEIRVAAGTYSGAAMVVVGTTPYTQVVAIVNKTLTLAGGYTNTNWTTPDAVLNRVEIDAQQHGRGMTIVGTWTEAVTVTGLTIFNGDYTGMGNPPGGYNGACISTGGDCGGGLFAKEIRLVLLDSRIVKNTVGRNPSPSHGGGAMFWNLLDGSRVENTIFGANSAPNGAGGGLYMHYGDTLTFSGCTFQENESYIFGGGLGVFQPSGLVTIKDTAFFSNTTTQGSGGALSASVVMGGGDTLRLDRVTMVGNEAVRTGAAVVIEKAGAQLARVSMSNVLLTGNRLESPGAYGGVFATQNVFETGLDLQLAHFTVADNFAPSAFHFRDDFGGSVTATLTNTLIVSASKAFVGAESPSGQVTIRHTKTMRQYVPTTHAFEAGTPTFVQVDPVTGNPRLDATYHLRKGSDAINAGVDAGVTRDIDYNRRPIGSAPDIGADEYGLFKYLPVVMGR